jgi:hypothetical protein
MVSSGSGEFGVCPVGPGGGLAVGLARGEDADEAVAEGAECLVVGVAGCPPVVVVSPQGGGTVRGRSSGFLAAHLPYLPGASDQVTCHAYEHLGLAVDTKLGLMTPVIH